MGIFEQVSAGAAGLLVIEGAIALTLWFEARPEDRRPEHWCRATLTEFSCTFTNAKEKPTRGSCVVGVLKPAASGPALAAPDKMARSAVVCSGPLAGRATELRSAPWRSGSPESVCSRDGKPDWEACELSILLE